jgi:hypothetical protein
VIAVIDDDTERRIEMGPQRPPANASLVHNDLTPSIEAHGGAQASDARTDDMTTPRSGMPYRRRRRGRRRLPGPPPRRREALFAILSRIEP